MTDTAAPRFTAEEMLYVAASHDIDGDEKTADMLRQAAADLAGAPTREELIVAIHKGLAGYPIDAEAYPMIVQDVTDALIAAGVKVRHE